MHDALAPAYHALLGSPAQLTRCRQASSMADLLATLRTLWNLPDWSDARLFQAIDWLNREAQPGHALLAGHWLPYRYHAASRTIHWCLPDGPATEPFHEEYTMRCRQRIALNQLVRPQTPLAALQAGTAGVASARPAGFIFHLSRCGSTLVSGCLSELDSAQVHSESQVLTEILLDTGLDRDAKRLHLRQLIDLAASVAPERPDLIIKWNAWDLFAWDLIRELYPTVPALLLVREPVEILASHHLVSGRHMSGDPTLAHVAPAFADAGNSTSVLDYRIGILSALMSAMAAAQGKPNTTFLHYRQLDAETMARVATWFGLPLDSTSRDRMRRRMQRNAKLPDQHFEPDGARKAAVFSAEECASIARRLAAQHDLLAGYASVSALCK